MKTDSESDIIELIRADHVILKDLIQTLKDENLEKPKKHESFETFFPLLIAHAKAEEESLYVQMKNTGTLRVEGLEGDTEHAIAEQLVHEINGTPDDDEWQAKVIVLAKLVETHIRQEEDVVLTKVEENLDQDARQTVGEQYLQLKSEVPNGNLFKEIPYATHPPQ